jgi:hypothetical protein
MPIHIRDKVKALARNTELFQGEHSHLRPEVGAADADVHDVGDGRVIAYGLRVGQH